MKINTKKIGIFLGPFVFLLLLLGFEADGLSSNAKAVLACTSWIAIWWIFESVPLAITSLLPIVLFPLTGGLSISETTSSYGNKFIFLYLGGFFIAIAIEKWNLHKRLAINIIYKIGTNFSNIILGFMLATAFLSMWISNTAAALIMLPIAVAIVNHFSIDSDEEDKSMQQFGKAIMLAIAYSASIGGIATLIGTPTNLVMVSVLKEELNIEISFADWLLFAFPISLLLLFFCWFYLTKISFKFKSLEIVEYKQQMQIIKNNLGEITSQEKKVAIIFGLTAFFWLLNPILLNPYFPFLDDTIIVLIFSSLLFVVSSKKNEKLLEWKDTVKVPWDIILLFGGGLSLAKGFESSGLASFIGKSMNAFAHLEFILLLLVIITLVNFLTEVTSNTATVAILLPVFIPIAIASTVNPLYLIVATTLASSCAFMLPVATPPNAIVFGSGFLKIKDMVRTGFVMNIVSIIIIALFVYYFLPYFF